MKNSEKIINSWNANAEAWIKTIEGNEIESRTAATNNAIVKCILEYRPDTIMDIGCGEGWLTRTLRGEGILARGFDAVPALVNRAIEKDGEHYAVISFKEIIEISKVGKAEWQSAVINFALIDKEETEMLIHALPAMLKKGGILFIQTLHSFNIENEDAYVSGWKQGSWNGMKQKFIKPYQWYYRTVGDWVSLFTSAGFSVKEINEPLHPVTKKPLSLLFVLKNTKAISS